jgi:hypothetical protein
VVAAVASSVSVSSSGMRHGDEALEVRLAALHAFGAAAADSEQSDAGVGGIGAS